jgi:hypothetical protein
MPLGFDPLAFRPEQIGNLMKTYPKIETLYNRGDDFKVDFSLRRPEFGLINKWMVQEKVDGTNIRVNYSLDRQPVMHFGNAQPAFVFGGRTDNALLPAPLLARLNEIFDDEQAAECRARCVEYGVREITFFGEGFGPGIQNGSLYGPSVDFICFDILVDDRTWLQPADVIEVCAEQEILRVPILGWHTTSEIEEMVRKGVRSQIAPNAIPACEGIIARPIQNLFDQRGNRVMFKLKTTDFPLTEIC